MVIHCSKENRNCDPSKEKNICKGCEYVPERQRPLMELFEEEEQDEELDRN